MPCYKPIIKAETTKYKNNNRLRGKMIRIPCGRCIGCRLEYSRQWAMRCYHESMVWKQNCFITLTYNPDHLPSDGSIHRSHLQKFVKRLRKKIWPKGVRYYGSGEYGPGLGRPHYHMCLFGYDFEDKKIHEYGKGSLPGKNNRSGEFDVYWSPTLEKIWGQGFCTVGEMTFESAAYCARYVTKKINGPLEKEHYKGLTPEFSLMSQKPGLGEPFLNRYYNEVYPKDFVVINGKKYKPCRFYDKYLMKRDFKLWEEIKERRKNKIVYEDENRMYQKGLHKKEITKPLIRRLEINE